MNLEKLRPGQLGALEVIFERLQAGETHTAIVLATRYGKSDVIRLVAYLASEQGLISGAIAFSPADNLSEQLIRPHKIKAMAERYGLDLGPLLKRARRLRSFSEIRPFSNGEYLLAANTQLALQTNVQDCCDLIKAERQRTGRPVMLFIDECHVLAEQQKWGEFFKVATGAGAVLVLLTATAVRADGDRIPGFEYEMLSEEEAIRFFVTDAGDLLHNRISKWRGCERIVKLKPHYEVTFRDAWAEKPSPLCDISRTVIDVDIHVDSSSGPTCLRDMSVREAQRALTKAVRDPVVMEQGVRKMLQHLRAVQACNPECAAIVYTASDQSGGNRDDHAHAIKDLCRHMGPTYLKRTPEVTIVTMNTLDDEKASERLLPFIGDDHTSGHGDILIVKQIGGAGLDCPRLKVALDLSPVRTVAATIQRLMRPATPLPGSKIAHVVTLDDPMMNALFHKFIRESGGELTEAKIWEAENLEESWLKPKPEAPPPLSGVRFGDSELSGYDDSHGNVGQMTIYAKVMELRERIPQLAGACTDAELCDRLKDCSFMRDDVATTYEERTHRTLETALDGLKRQINKAADDCATKRTMQQCGRPYDAAIWPEHRRQILTTAKRGASVPRGVKLGDITNLDTLTCILGILEAEVDRLF